MDLVTKQRKILDKALQYVLCDLDVRVAAAGLETQTINYLPCQIGPIFTNYMFPWSLFGQLILSWNRKEWVGVFVPGSSAL